MKLWWQLGYVACGLFAGYMWWKLPLQVQAVREHRARRTRQEIDRIRGGISRNFYVPNALPPLFLRMRILEYFKQWWAETTPRRPEEVAYQAHIKEIDGHQQDGDRRSVVRRTRQAAVRQPQGSAPCRAQAPRRTQESLPV